MLCPTRTRLRKYAETAAIYLGTMATGLAQFMVGPSLCALAIQNTITLRLTSVIIFVQSIGYLIGSLFSRCTYQRFNTRILYSATFFICAGCTVGCGLSRTLVLTAAFFLIQGICLGFTQIGSVMMLNDIWGIGCQNSVEGLLASAAVGYVLAPSIVRPFLPKEHEFMPNFQLRDINRTIISSTPIPRVANFSSIPLGGLAHAILNTTDPRSTTSTNQIYISFSLASIFMMITAIWFLIMFYIKFNTSLDDDEREVDVNSCEIFRKRVRPICYVTLIFLFVLFSSGAQNVFGNLLPVYVTLNPIETSDTSASDVTIVFWVVFIASRALYSLVRRWVKIQKLLFVSVLFCNLSSFMLPYSKSDITYVWVGATLMAMGLAPIFPATLEWAKECFYLSERRIFIMWTATVVGYSSCAALVLFLMAYYTSLMYVYFTIGINLILLVIFICLTAMRTKEILYNESNVNLIMGSDDNETDISDTYP